MNRFVKHALFACILAASSAGVTRGAVLNLAGTQPDVFIDTGAITYTASNHTFVVTGVAEYFTNGGQTPIVSGQFKLTAVLNKTSGSGPTDVFTPALSGSSLSITGNGGTIFFTSTSLADFGYSTTAGSDNFQFLFQNGSGTLSHAGWTIGVQLHGTGGTTYAAASNGLDADFTEVLLPTATADTFNVAPAAPLPPALWGGAFLLGGLGLTRLRRRNGSHA